MWEESKHIRVRQPGHFTANSVFCKVISALDHHEEWKWKWKIQTCKVWVVSLQWEQTDPKTGKPNQKNKTTTHHCCCWKMLALHEHTHYNNQPKLNKKHKVCPLNVYRAEILKHSQDQLHSPEWGQMSSTHTDIIEEELRVALYRAEAGLLSYPC